LDLTSDFWAVFEEKSCKGNKQKQIPFDFAQAGSSGMTIGTAKVKAMWRPDKRVATEAKADPLRKRSEFCDRVGR
jgi:hypothetical protein